MLFSVMTNCSLQQTARRKVAIIINAVFISLRQRKIPYVKEGHSASGQLKAKGALVEEVKKTRCSRRRVVEPKFHCRLPPCMSCLNFPVSPTQTGSLPTCHGNFSNHLDVSRIAMVWNPETSPPLPRNVGDFPRLPLTSMVRSHLEFSNSVWSPYKIGLTEKNWKGRPTKKEQPKWYRLGKVRLSYMERLKVIGILPLNIGVVEEIWLKPSKFCMEFRPMTLLGVVNVWNSLPEHVVNSSSV